MGCGETRACLGRELDERPFSGIVAGVWEGGTGDTKGRVLTVAVEELGIAVFEHVILLSPERRGVGVVGIGDRVGLTMAFFLSTPGPTCGLSSPVFAEALATQLYIPSRVCADGLSGRVAGAAGWTGSGLLFDTFG